MLKLTLPVKKGFCCCAHFSLFSAGGVRPLKNGREAVGIPGVAGNDTNNKEVPLDARESDPEMQRVQAEKLQYHEEQEEHPGQA